MGATIGVLHPGEMGAGIAGALVRAGHEVWWSSSGRSAESNERATREGLHDAGSVAALLERCDAVLSICPPHAAIDLARQVAGFRGLFLDANAISPAHAAEVAAIVEQGGAHAVDGGLIGSPPPADRTRLYLSGQAAPEVADLFTTEEVRVTVLAGDRFAASAMKAAYAAWTKGTAALILAVRATARAYGVEEDLVGEWQSTSPELLDQSRRAARQAEDRGWRWVGEMAEIAATFEAAGLPAGFHDGAGRVFSRAPRHTGVPASEETLDEVLNSLLGR